MDRADFMIAVGIAATAGMFLFVWFAGAIF
jgi:hypothetical protein